MDKPADMFDRDHEWRSLGQFVEATRPGATLGLVYGRRRQGKTFLLESLTESHQGFYFQALRQSDAQNLERLAQAYGMHTAARTRVAFANWDEALDALLALGETARSPVPVVIDEFPYLLDGAPQLASLLQAHLRPRSTAVSSWPTRLILCGSALSTMQGLLAGSAPLRGRASLELTVHPFGYRDAAEFWGVAEHQDMAMRLHALVGGTAGYLDMSGGSGPASPSDLDDWVAHTLLDPASAMFREGNILLAEEPRLTDASVYFAVLAAISQGCTRPGEIAAALGKPATGLAHPLRALTETRLVTPLDDALKRRRTTYHIAEPILRFHQLVIAPNEARLGRHQAPAVWSEVRDTVSSRIYGPHFEHLARVWCAEHASPQTLVGPVARDTVAVTAPSLVAPTRVACRQHNCNHEVDVVAVHAGQGQRPEILAIGEAKWNAKSIGLDQLRRLEHLRKLLGLADVVKLLVFSRSGFDRELSEQADRRPDVELVNLERLYLGS